MLAVLRTEPYTVPILFPTSSICSSQAQVSTHDYIHHAITLYVHIVYSSIHALLQWHSMYSSLIFCLPMVFLFTYILYQYFSYIYINYLEIWKGFQCAYATRPQHRILQEAGFSYISRQLQQHSPTVIGH